MRLFLSAIPCNEFEELSRKSLYLYNSSIKHFFYYLTDLINTFSNFTKLITIVESRRNASENFKSFVQHTRYIRKVPSHIIIDKSSKFLMICQVYLVLR